MKADLRTLDLNLLKTLDALLDERSVTRAGASCPDPTSGKRHA